MRFPDPYALRREEPKKTVIFSASQLSGSSGLKEDYFLNFNDECFALADGVSAMPNGDVAAKLACETAIWGYKHIRQRRTYWLDKKLFMKRIFRTTNMTIWQKRRDPGFGDGLATTLMVLMVSEKYMWLGNAGHSSAWMWHNGMIRKLTDERKDFEKIPRHALGLKRLGLVSTFTAGPFQRGDVLLLVTRGVSDYLTASDLQTSMASAGTTVSETTNAVVSVLSAAQTNGSQESMTACMITRLPK